MEEGTEGPRTGPKTAHELWDLRTLVRGLLSVRKGGKGQTAQIKGEEPLGKKIKHQVASGLKISNKSRAGRAEW